VTSFSRIIPHTRRSPVPHSPQTLIKEALDEAWTVDTVSEALDKLDRKRL